MPNRFIKDICRTSRTLESLSDFEERLFWRLITVADDFGRFEADPEIVRSLCFPLKPTKRPLSSVSKCLQKLAHANTIYLYVVEGRPYGWFINFERFQGKPRAKVSKYPDPEKHQQNSMLADDSKCSQMHPSSVFVFRENLSDAEVAGRHQSTPQKSMTWPTDFTLTDDLRQKAEAYWKKQGRVLDVGRVWDKFAAHHQAKGSRFVSWPAAWQTWYVGAVDFPQNGHTPQSVQPAPCQARIEAGPGKLKFCGQPGVQQCGKQWRCQAHVVVKA